MDSEDNLSMFSDTENGSSAKFNESMDQTKVINILT